MATKFSYADIRQKLIYISNVLHRTQSQEKYISNADKWRCAPDDYRMYRNNIDCHEVFPNIIVGNAFAALSKSFLKDIGVTHVLNCALNQFLNEVHLNEDYYRDTNIRFKGFELDDICSENITRCFEEANNFIDDCLRNGGKILIHCLAGVSRSATITIAYLMMRHAMTLEEAIKEVKQNRRICPNEGFLRQLVELDLMLNQQRHP
ncbi:Dual specificity phosphatase DUPD1 [Sarcoptes scabiei]|nr:Dual specificity phosphatase DUPD1 [Sarcoptes scabiei]